MKAAIGIDLGGSQVKGMAFHAETGEECLRLVEETGDGREAAGVPAWAEAVRAVHRRLEEALGGRADVVGLCAPGLADREHTRIRFMPGRLAGLENLVWADFLERPVAVLNDAHAALLGEIRHGAARGVDDVFMLTLGTGVGGAVVSGGRLLRGHLGRAGHLGHLSLDPGGAPDICGTPGSLEDAVGDCTVRQRSGGRFGSTRELLEAAAAGDAEARAVWEKSVTALAAGVAGLINVLDPEVVVVGGGIANAGELLWEPLRRNLDGFEWRPAGHRVEVRPALLGEWAGCHGAAWFAEGGRFRE